MTDRRLSRVPMRVQWMATIDLAIAWAEGRAAWMQTTITYTGEERWWWPSSTIPVYARTAAQDPGAYSGYWYVSVRIARRVRALVNAAMLAALCAGRGSCSVGHVDCDTARVLKRWQRSGRWQRRVSPQHARRDDVGPVEKTPSCTTDSKPRARRSNGARPSRLDEPTTCEARP